MLHLLVASHRHTAKKTKKKPNVIHLLNRRIF